MPARTSSKQIVTACANQSCRSYGIPVNLLPSLRQRYTEGIPCKSCESKINPSESYASIKCNSCKKFKNYLHKDLLPELKTQSQVACTLCGGLDTQVRFFAQVNEIPNEITESRQTSIRSKKEPNQTNVTISKTVKTKSGVSLPPPLPESPKINLHKKSQPSTPQYEKKQPEKSIENHRSKKDGAPLYVSLLDQGAPQKKQRPKTTKPPQKQKTQNRPWKNQHSSGGIVKPKDEFDVPDRNCAECGAKISISTLQARPDTKYCINHIEKAGRFMPVSDGIMSREGAKQMRGKDGSLAQQSKKIL